MSGKARPLEGVNVLVTRPKHQSALLAEGIRNLGGNPVIFPVLVISDVKDKTSVMKCIERLEEYDLCIFVSPNAVHKAMHLIRAARSLPSQMKIAVVGKGSADALREYGIKDVIVPTGRYDSEALLGHEALQQVSGKRIVIFRGNGGRPLLGDTLKQRGAILDYAECYRREKPDVDVTELLSNWSHGRINAVIITSSEGLHNLFDIVGRLGQQLLRETPVFTAHERIAEFAREAGLTRVILTTMAADEGIIQSLREYFSVRKDPAAQVIGNDFVGG